MLRIINEPTAASLAYGLDKKSNETILVFDLGGGTFDVSILEVGDGVFEVLSTSGDTHLGGDDFDKRSVDWMAEDFQTSEGIDLRKDRQALQRLTEAAEKAKIELSSTPQTSLSLPFITATADGPKHIDTSLTRAKFEQLCGDLLERCAVPVKNALKVRALWGCAGLGAGAGAGTVASACLSKQKACRVGPSAKRCLLRTAPNAAPNPAAPPFHPRPLYTPNRTRSWPTATWTRSSSSAAPPASPPSWSWWRSWRRRSQT